MHDVNTRKMCERPIAIKTNARAGGAVAVANKHHQGDNYIITKFTVVNPTMFRRWMEITITQNIRK